MIDISISNRQMRPAVIHTNQLEDRILRFKLDSYTFEGKDLSKCTAYAQSSINGRIDVTKLSENEDGTHTWVISDHTLQNQGVITYQIKFVDDTDATVWYSYKGVIVNREVINGDDYISANYPTLMNQWLNTMHTLAGNFGAPITFMLPGEPIPVGERLANRMYYQWEDSPNSAAKCATAEVNLGEHPYADSGLYINNVHICVDETEEEAYVIDSGIWVDAINNANCGVIAADISSGNDIILFLSAKDAGEIGNDIPLELGYAKYGKGKGVHNPSGGGFSPFSGGCDSTVGNDKPKGRFEDSDGNILGFNDEISNTGYQTENVGTANVVLISNSEGNIAVSDVPVAKLAYLKDVTSNIQSQINGKQASITGGASTITSANLTASRVVVSNSDGKVSASGVTTEKLDYLKNVTSDVQTQLNGKLSKKLSEVNRVLVTDGSGNIKTIPNVGISELTCLSGATSNIQEQIDSLVNGVPMPDYSNGVSIESGATVPVNSLCVVSGDGRYGWLWGKVDGVLVAKHNCADKDGGDAAINFPVPAGSVVEFGGIANYYPYK